MSILSSNPRPNDYPFGSTLNTRSFSAGISFRFGFIGKENFDQYQDLGFRTYDSELGEFLVLEPLSTIYPYYVLFDFRGKTIDRIYDEENK